MSASRMGIERTFETVDKKTAETEFFLRKDDGLPASRLGWRSKSIPPTSGGGSLWRDCIGMM